jgi:hypothetical protein
MTIGTVTGAMTTTTSSFHDFTATTGPGGASSSSATAVAVAVGVAGEQCAVDNHNTEEDFIMLGQEEEEDDFVMSETANPSAAAAVRTATASAWREPTASMDDSNLQLSSAGSIEVSEVCFVL